MKHFAQFVVLKGTMRRIRINSALLALPLLAFLTGFPGAGSAAPQAQVVSLASLLNEMVDRDALAKWPIPAYSCKEASSHDRRKNDPSNAETWHSNNDHEQFIRTETNENRKEWVIMEESGPGAVTRFWTPLQAKLDQAIIRFYFDGSSTPAIAVKFNDLFRGCGFVHPPFAFVSWNETDLRNQMKTPRKEAQGVGADLYLPIPFARGCKITLDQVPFYYVINFRSYEPGADVKTFTMADYAAAQNTLERVGEILVSAPNAAIAGDEKQGVLSPGETLTLDLPDGPAAVNSLQVQVAPKDAPQVLRSVVLEARFDGETTVDCPVGEFFGAGARLNPVRDWWRTVSQKGTLAARWVMPFQHTARFALKNGGAKPVSVKLTATTETWKWDERSMYFHANWHGQSEIKTRPYSDWNYLDVHGRGVYVGDTLTVFSPVAAWYGEGDERILIDGDSIASHIGTGTEDYYGYAWGMAGFFNSPFISIDRKSTRLNSSH